MMYAEFLEAGMRVFALWPIQPDGTCGCGDPECESVGKHPRASNWQHTPLWSPDQIDVMEEMDQFATGYGVLVSPDLLVVDVDERNGGAESYQKLLEDTPEVAGAGMVVRTGSGGQSRHLYFKMPEQQALLQHLQKYPGIDFKSTGFVVGPGSHHISGGQYEVLAGSPYDLEPAPESLLSKLRKPDRHRSSVNGQPVDVSLSDVESMLESIDPDTDHETWIRCGMAIHHATGGTGLDIWDSWSSNGQKYPGFAAIEKRWHSFGKTAQPVTIGTLAHYAEQAGWIAPVEFTSDVHFDPPSFHSASIDDESVDLLRPPGFTGRLAEWINSRSRYPREHLATAAALATVSSVAGMRYVDELDGITPNLFLFGVAASATGKESVLKAHQELLRAAGVSAAVHGGIKSEQEIYRNLIRHQAALYVLDELGEQLAKIQNARTKGTASYLEGVIGTVMSIYSKANSHALITGDLQEEIRQQLQKDVAAINKRMDDQGENEADQIRLNNLTRQLDTISQGIECPYLGIFGLTTPERFDAIMDFDMAVNGFLGRALIFREREDNPVSKPRGSITRGAVPDDVAATLQNLYAPGVSDMQATRVERIGGQVAIPTRPEAEEMLDEVIAKFHALAEQAKNETGLTAIPRRGYEQVAKVSMLLAIPEGLRTAEHVRWAYALVKRDIDEKMNLAHSNSATDKLDALASTIMSLVTDDHGETAGRLRNRCRKYRKQDVETCLDKLVKAGHLKAKEVPAGRGKTTVKYFSAVNS